MRLILEKALIALLNEEKDKADVLFHDFILERSRQIHESLRQGEDFILDESMDEDMSIDEMFGDHDLEEDDELTAGDDTQADDAQPVGDDDGMADDDMDATDDESEEEPETVEDRVTDLESELQRLAAEFDALMSGDAVPGEDTDEFDDEEETVSEDVIEISTTSDGSINVRASTDDEDDMGDDMSAPAMDMGMDAAPVGDDDMSMDDFDDLSESIVDELEKVTVASGDGRLQGNEKFKQNGVSPVPNHGVNDRAFKGKPVKSVAPEKNGYERETAPATKKLATDARNTKAKATDGRTGVKKDGDSAAILNKLNADPAGQKSLLGSKNLK